MSLLSAGFHGTSRRGCKTNYVTTVQMFVPLPDCRWWAELCNWPPGTTTNLLLLSLPACTSLARNQAKIMVWCKKRTFCCTLVVRYRTWPANKLQTRFKQKIAGNLVELLLIGASPHDHNLHKDPKSTGAATIIVIIWSVLLKRLLMQYSYIIGMRVTAT